MAASNELLTQIDAASAKGKLLESAAKNVRALLANASSDLYTRVVAELVAGQHWNELNDRFYKMLEFGTGGLRGRTIGKIVTKAEQGKAAPGGRPEFPCVGTNAMNIANVNRATQGLVAYAAEWHAKKKIDNRPKIVIAHDTRFFSDEFTDLAAKVASENGCDPFVFDGPRSTPELSFAVRHLNATAGIVITASHNPPHDNGYKVYFADGAQVIAPHDRGIIEKVNAITSESYEPLPKDRQGKITTLGAEIDEAYMKRLETIVVDRTVLEHAKSLKIVFTPLHGTGAITLRPMFERLGFNFQIVPEQEKSDPRFSTVKSPNPENAEALTLGIELAKKTNADVVIATDPDCDRIGVAVRNANGEMILINGNQIGSLLAYYRLKKFFELGILNEQNRAHAVTIKTFVTTDMQKLISESFGVRCVETLTGFKFFGAKLEKYERALPEEISKKYRQMSEEETRAARLKYSTFYVFGSEESYGYSGADFVRDKDGNAGAIMFCEMAAYAKSRGQTVDQLLDEAFTRFGYFEEKNASIYFEGAEGADKITRLLESYANNPPTEIAGSKVTGITDFEKQTIRDVEGDVIPKQKMSIFELEDQTRIAVRGSGTEPKIKYYIFGRLPSAGKFKDQGLAAVKSEIGQRLKDVWSFIEKDAHARAK
ncbi:MAG TPA: phospho-sugar mutase [Chthoniobacterales bacterium]|jgi:phosphoglucomutase|nr:phospho-sugar mutase [Chthoniobacterales bacterium]